MYLLLYRELSDKMKIERLRLGVCQFWISVADAAHVVLLLGSPPALGSHGLWEWSVSSGTSQSLCSCSRPFFYLFLFTPVAGPCAAALASGCWPLVSPEEL